MARASPRHDGRSWNAAANTPSGWVATTRQRRSLPTQLRRTLPSAPAAERLSTGGAAAGHLAPSVRIRRVREDRPGVNRLVNPGGSAGVSNPRLEQGHRRQLTPEGRNRPAVRGLQSPPDVSRTEMSAMAVQPSTLRVTSQTAGRLYPDRSSRRRTMEAVAFVGVWMLAGYLLQLGSDAYLLVGIPLTIGFQVLVRRRPLRELFAGTTTRFSLDKKGFALA